MVINYLKDQNADLALKAQNMQIKNNKFVTIGDIEHEERPTKVSLKKPAKQRDTSVPKARQQDEPELTTS